MQYTLSKNNKKIAKSPDKWHENIIQEKEQNKSVNGQAALFCLHAGLEPYPAGDMLAEICRLYMQGILARRPALSLLMMPGPATGDSLQSDKAINNE